MTDECPSGAHLLHHCPSSLVSCRTAQLRFLEVWKVIVAATRAISANSQVKTIIADQWSRESVLIEPGFWMSGQLVAEALDRVSCKRSLSRSIRVDHGTEFTSKAVDEWAWKNGVQLDFVRPGKPTENGMIESFHGRFRDECLNCNEFESLADAQSRIEAWRMDYNYQRPHSALGHLTPKEYIRMHQPAGVRSCRIPFTNCTASGASSKRLHAVATMVLVLFGDASYRKRFHLVHYHSPKNMLE